MTLTLSTPRLNLYQVRDKLSKKQESQLLLSIVVELLSPKVVQNLPPYFHNIDSITDAKIWLDHMVDESQLFVIAQKSSALTIGFLFIYEQDNGEAHIGYLLGEDYWQKGFASELLSAFIEYATKEQKYSKLIGGVDKSNKSSAYLLEKLGFKVQGSSAGEVNFYEYIL